MFGRNNARLCRPLACRSDPSNVSMQPTHKPGIYAASPPPAYMDQSYEQPGQRTAQPPQHYVPAPPGMYGSVEPNQYYQPAYQQHVIVTRSINPCAFFCLLIPILVANSLTAVWTTFFFTSEVVLVVTSTIAGFAVCRGKNAFIVPFTVSLFAAAFCSVMLLGLTYLDYSHKCDDHKNLNQRTLQNAYPFDCEAGGIVGIVFWVIGMIILSILQFVLAILSCNAARSMQRVQGEDERIEQPLVSPSGVESSSEQAADGGRRAGAKAERYGMWLMGTVGAIVILAMAFVISFKPLAHAVPGECPANAGPGFFENGPQINDLGCCTWLKSEGTCCQQAACNLKYDFYLQTDTAASQTCEDILGLLSCSPCHSNSGLFTHGQDVYTNITVCASFCEQLYESCNVGMTSSAVDFCVNTLGVNVAPAFQDPLTCFGAGSRSFGTGVSLWGMIVALIVASWTLAAHD